MKTVDIKGKPYVTVAERIKYFRENFAGWSLDTEIVELTEERCVFRAVIRDEAGLLKSSGTAYELASSSYINKTSYIENCETSAWGRALGNLGIGIDASIASAEEMVNAFTQQSKKSAQEATQDEPEPLTANQKKMINELIKTTAKKLEATNKAVTANIEHNIGKPISEMNAKDYAEVCRLVDGWTR